ncbi:MAG: rhodanese-like domain-containing protein [Betaproteobacteria bacterium]
MITIETTGRLITVGVFGEFALADFQRFEREVLETLRVAGRVDLLLDLRDMQGYTLDVAWEDLRFVRAHAHDFRRVAVVSSQRWHGWLAWVNRLLVDAQVQLFEREDGARHWLAAETEPAPRFTNWSTLLSIADLAAHLHDPGVVVFDCRHDLMKPGYGADAYRAAHLPGARFASVDRDLAGPVTGRNGRHPLPDPRVFVDWLGRMGVSNDTQVVAYDQAGGLYAARLWWMLKHWFGHHRAAVLDGGWELWVRTGHLVTDAVPAPIATSFQGTPGDASVTVDEVLAHLGDGSMHIVDARAADRFRGENETIDPVGGHIPGAANRFFRDNLDALGFFRPRQELHTAFEAVAAGRPAHVLVHQCGSGISACHNLLAMDIAGLSGSRLYAGSWSEWCADPARPVER